MRRSLKISLAVLGVCVLAFIAGAGWQGFKRFGLVSPRGYEAKLTAGGALKLTTAAPGAPTETNPPSAAYDRYGFIYSQEPENGLQINENGEIHVSIAGLDSGTALLRSAGDFDTFTLKAVPAGADILLLEDSADSGAKKKVAINTLSFASVGDAAADGATKGVVTFLASDFNCASGLCSIDYSNGQAASASTKGFLTSSDFSTFYNKQDALGYTAVPTTTTVCGHALSGNVTCAPSDVSLGNVTNAAQLLRTADYGNFTAKTTPVGADLLLIEDSESSFVKKKSTITQVLAATGGGFALTSNPLSQFASTTSAQLASVLSDETGSGGGFVRATGPTLSNPIIHGINAQTGTSYTVLTSDEEKLVTFSNSSAVAVTLAQANTTGFTSGTVFYFRNLGNGAVTITPTTSTIDGAATLVLRNGMSVAVFSDGTNYSTMVMGSANAFTCTQTDTTPITINPTTCAQVHIAELSQSTTFNAPSPATASNGQELVISIYSTTARTLSFSTASNGFSAEAGTTLPVTSFAGAYRVLRFRWNVLSSKWALINDSREDYKAVQMTDAATVTIDANITKDAYLTSLSQTTNFANPTGTKRIGQKFIIYIVSSTTRSLTWGSDFAASSSIGLPSATTGSSVEDAFGFRWNGTKWVIIATSAQVSVQDAAADATTKGISTYTAADFNASSGVISIDYSNAQKVSASVPGFLTAANYTAFNKGYIHLPVIGAHQPSTNMAIIDRSENHEKLLFDDTTAECAWWNFRMPPDYTSGLTAKIPFSAASATSGTFIFGVYVMAVTPGDSADNNTDSYASVNTSAGTTVPGTAGYLGEISVTLTNADSLAAGDEARIKVCRDVSDTATGDAEILNEVMIEYAKQ